MSAAQIPATPAKMQPIWLWPTIAAASLVIGALAAWWAKPAAEPPPVGRFTIPMSGVRTASSPVSSPDGRYIAMRLSDSSGTSGTKIWDAREGRFEDLPGGESHSPIGFSPSGQWILTRSRTGFFRTRMPTGRPIGIGDYDQALWLSDDELVVKTTSGEFARLSIESRAISKVEIADPEGAYDELYPVAVVTGSSRVLMGGDPAGASSVSDTDILVLDLDSGAVHRILEGAYPVSVFRDWLIYATGEVGGMQIVAQRMAPNEAGLVGVPVDVVSGVRFPGLVGAGSGDILVRIDAPFQARPRSERVFSWVDPDSGKAVVSGLPLGDYDRFSFSPDGAAIAVEHTVEEAGTNIYVLNLANQTEQRLTYRAAVNRAPVWAKSGRIYYATGPPLDADIYVKNADGSGDEELVVEGGDYPDVSPDGRWLVFTREGNGGDLYAKDLESGDVIAIDTTEMRTTDAAISPDGRFVAYSVDSPNSGTGVSPEQRVVVRSFPDPSGQYVRVAEQTADDPRWSPDGSYLYFRYGTSMSRMRVDVESTFRPVSNPAEYIRLAGANIRLAFNPADGRLLAVHNLITETPESEPESRDVTVEVILSFERFLNELAPR